VFLLAKLVAFVRARLAQGERGKTGAGSPAAAA
jgi:hypothetical protein